MDKATFQKEIEAKLKEWNKIIDELRAEGDRMLRSGEDLTDHAGKSLIIYNKYLEAREELKKLSKNDTATWEKHQANIKRIMGELDYLWSRCFKAPR